MYSPVFLSCPTTSGSPPVLSISLSDHSFSVLASSFACILAHSRPLWRFMFFSKRAFHALSSCSHCSGDKPFLLLLMFLAVVALIVVASCVSYLLLRCAPPHGSSFGLSLRSYQFAVSTPFGVHPRSEEHTSELQSRLHIVCRLLLEKKHLPTSGCTARARCNLPDFDSSCPPMYRFSLERSICANRPATPEPCSDGKALDTSNWIHPP